MHTEDTGEVESRIAPSELETGRMMLSTDKTVAHEDM